MAKQNRSNRPSASLVLTRDVLVIDNGPLRQRSFAEAQKVIKKIERLEEKIHIFHTSDQKLFNQWVDLTFRKNRAAEEQARNKYLELARFHNWIVATAHKLEIEMPQAFVLMREEQIRWRNGTEEERRQIDLAREKREDYIRQEMQNPYNESYSYDEDDETDPEDGGIDGLGMVLDQIEDSILDNEPASLSSAEERIDRILSLPDDQLALALENEEASFMLFDVSLNWGQRHRDYSLFKRIWLLMKNEQKDFFARVYASVTEAPIEEFLQQIGLPTDWTEEQSKDPEEDEEPFNFDDEYIGETARPRPTSAKAESSNDDKIKQVFRKLMRKLHPDMHVSEVKDGPQPEWVQRMWGLVQKAYNERNAGSLERLLKLTLIRMNMLDELSMSEIAEAKHWLKQDFEALEEESADLKNSMAWGFSGKKNYVSLTRKIEKQFEGSLRRIMSEVDTLEHQHQMLEALARQPRRYERQRRTTSRRGRSGQGGRSRSRRQSGYGQQEFSFED
jgi:hypothetical protein